MFESWKMRKYDENRKVDRWFHRKYNKQSQFDHVKDICAHFETCLRRENFVLDTSYKQFVYSISDFICCSKKSYETRAYVSGPYRKHSYPPEWTNDCEELWNELLAYRYFNDEFWESFWEQHSIEDKVFKSCISELIVILPMYIRRDLNVLVQHQLIEIDNDEVVRWEEYLYDEFENEEDD